jgi:hypothetical protein
LKPARTLGFLLAWFMVLVLPVSGQFAGPAILSRGEAPAAMATPQISFRPFVGISALYNTGLAGVSVTSTGVIAHETSPGILTHWGVGGTHSWRHTKVGLDYHGNFNYYSRTTYFTSLNHSLLLGVTHNFTRHIQLTLRESAGVFSRDFERTGLQQTVPFDPSTTYIPTTDYFDNRTYYMSSQADLTIQKSNRLSFNFGGDAYLARRRSSALYGTTGLSARGDVQYRLSRRNTIGAIYNYGNFRFTRVFGGSDVHGLAVSFARALTARMEFSGFAGINRAESEFLEVVAVDPVITALLGITSGTRVSHSILYAPLVGGRFSRTFARGVAYIGGGHAFTPGNGLFLTTAMTTGMAGYNYTGLRRWGLGTNVSYNRGTAYKPVESVYASGSASLNASRTLTQGLHLTFSYAVRRYLSPTLHTYNRTLYDASAGIAFSPGDIPLRFW